MTLTGVFHTGITVADLDRSLRFYRDVLGLEVAREATVEGERISRLLGYDGARLRVAFLRLGAGASPNSMLELLEYQAPRGEPLVQEPRQAGSAHLCFFVDDIQQMHRRLLEAGATIRSRGGPVAMENPVRHVLYLHDPDGFAVELIQPGPEGRPYGL